MNNKAIQSKDELSNCDPIKAILMLVVVLCHCMSMYTTSGWGPHKAIDSSPFLGLFASWTGTFHVYCFTLISGYIFHYVKYERGGYQKWFPFIANKAKRLLVPYIFVACIWVVPIHIYFYGIGDIIDKYVLGISPDQLWFLLMLFWVVTIFWIISDVAIYKPILAAVIACALHILGMFVPNYFSLGRGLQYILYFYTGFLIRKYKSENKMLYKIPSFIYFITNFLLFIGVQTLKDREVVVIKILVFVMNVLLNITGAIGAFVILQRLANKFLVKNKIICFLSKHSMVIYLVHQQLIYFTNGWFNGVVSPVILVFLNFSFSLLVSVLFSVLMHKTRITRFLIGSK